MSDLLEVYYRLAAERNGFVLGMGGREITPPEGYAVGRRRVEDLETVESMMGPSLHLGYWRSNGKEYVDLVEIYLGQATAILAASVGGERAIYDFASGLVIEVARSDDAEGNDSFPVSQATGVEQGSQGEAKGVDAADQGGL